MNDLPAIFAPVFARKFQDQSSMMNTSLSSWMGGQRKEIFIDQDHVNTKLVKHNFDVRAELYLVYFRSISAVVGYYPQEKEVLWLDHHRSNADFNKFVLQEHLYDWLPNNLDEFVKLLIQTKFHFLGEPFLIKDKTDVPMLPADFKNHIQSSEDGAKELARREHVFSEIATMIYPPKLEKKNRAFLINFYIWTKILGKIINLSSSVSSDGIFTFQGSELGEGLGHFYVPR